MTETVLQPEINQPQTGQGTWDKFVASYRDLKQNFEVAYTAEDLNHERFGFFEGYKKTMAFYDYAVVQGLSKIGVKIGNENGFSGFRLESRKDYQEALGSGITGIGAIKLVAVALGAPALAQAYAVYCVGKGAVSVYKNRNAILAAINSKKESGNKFNLKEVASNAKTREMLIGGVMAAAISGIANDPALTILMNTVTDQFVKNVRRNGGERLTADQKSTLANLQAVLIGSRVASIGVGAYHFEQSDTGQKFVNWIKSEVTFDKIMGVQTAYAAEQLSQPQAQVAPVLPNVYRSGNYEVIPEANTPHAEIVATSTPPLAQIDTGALMEDRFMHGNTVDHLPSMEPHSPIEAFTFHSPDAADIAKGANAYLFQSDANYFHNVFRSSKFQPDFQIRIPSQFGNGDGTFTPLQETMHVSLGTKFHDELKGLLAQNGIVKVSDYKPENVGYTVYIKDGGHNQILTVTRDSNIVGLSIDKDGNLDMDPSIQAKVDGFTVVYVDKSGDNLKGIYNIGRVINANGRTGEPDFVATNIETTPPAAPAAPATPAIPDAIDTRVPNGIFNLADPEAGLLLAKHNATIVTSQTNDPSLINDFATGTFKVDGHPIPTDSVSIFEPSASHDLVFTNEMTPEQIASKFDKGVDEIVGSDVAIKPNQIKWQLSFYNNDTHQYIKLIVDQNTTLPGIEVTDKGLVLKPEIATRLVAVYRVYYGAQKTIILDSANVKSFKPSSLPDFIDFEE